MIHDYTINQMALLMSELDDLVGFYRVQNTDKFNALIAQMKARADGVKDEHESLRRERATLEKFLGDLQAADLATS